MGADDNLYPIPEMLLRGSLSDGQIDGFRCGASDLAEYERPPCMRTRSSSSSGVSHERGGALYSGSDLSDDEECRGKGAYHKGRGKGGDRSPSFALMPPSSLSDSLLYQGRGFTSPPATLLTLDCKSLRQTASLPAVLRVPEREREPGSERRLRLSQARLIIPRTVSEYFDCCRYSRSHSEGLLFASSRQSGAFVGCHDLAGKALSEGLLGGRMMPAIGEESRSAEGPPKPATPPRPIPVEELKEDTIVEGRIVELRHVGFLVEVGATQPGLLRRRHCQGCPRRLLQEGQVLSNLVVLKVDKERRRFSLALRGIDGSHLQEEAYDAVLDRIAGWAGVTLSNVTREEARTIAVGDYVFMTGDAEELRMSFESICHNWDIGMLNILGTKQQVVDVRADGSIIGLKEAVPDSGKPIWYYSASVFTLPASQNKSQSSKAVSSTNGDAPSSSRGRRGKGSSRASAPEDAHDTDERAQRTETPRAGKGAKGKNWQRREKSTAESSSSNAAASTPNKGKKGYGKGRGKVYSKGGKTNNGWNGGTYWW